MPFLFNSTYLSLVGLLVNSTCLNHLFASPEGDHGGEHLSHLTIKTGSPLDEDQISNINEYQK